MDFSLWSSLHHSAQSMSDVDPSSVSLIQRVLLVRALLNPVVLSTAVRAVWCLRVNVDLAEVKPNLESVEPLIQSSSLLLQLLVDLVSVLLASDVSNEIRINIRSIIRA